MEALSRSEGLVLRVCTDHSGVGAAARAPVGNASEISEAMPRARTAAAPPIALLPLAKVWASSLLFGWPPGRTGHEFAARRRASLEQRVDSCTNQQLGI